MNLCRPKRWISTPAQITGIFAATDPFKSGVDRGIQRILVARDGYRRQLPFRGLAIHRQNIMQYFNIDRSFISKHCGYGVIDLRRRGYGIVYYLGGDGYIVEDQPVGLEVACAVVKEYFLGALEDAGPWLPGWRK